MQIKLVLGKEVLLNLRCSVVVLINPLLHLLDNNLHLSEFAGLHIIKFVVYMVEVTHA